MEFDIVSGKVKVKPETLMVAELRAIWDSDDSQDKRIANDLLTYIHICAQVDPEAPFFNARRDEVVELAKANVWYGRECPYQNLAGFDTIIKAYLKSKEDSVIRIFKIFNHKIDQLQDTIDNITPELKELYTDKGAFRGYASNMKMLTDVMTELTEILDERDKLEQRMKKTAEKEGTYRAGKKQNRLEKRLLANQQAANQARNEHSTQQESTQVQAT